MEIVLDWPLCPILIENFVSHVKDNHRQYLSIIYLYLNTIEAVLRRLEGSFDIYEAFGKTPSALFKSQDQEQNNTGSWPNLHYYYISCHHYIINLSDEEKKHFLEDDHNVPQSGYGAVCSSRLGTHSPSRIFRPNKQIKYTVLLSGSLCN